MGFFKKEKSVPKTNVFDTLNMDGYYLPVLLPKQQTIITSITFSSCSQTAVIQGIGGVLHKIFIPTFGIPYCVVCLFLNEFLKSPEKLITEKTQESDCATYTRTLPLFHTLTYKRKRHLTML